MYGAEVAERLHEVLTRALSERERSRRFFLAYCVAMILAYAMLVPAIARPGFPMWGPGDFTIFYTAAHILRGGNAHRLYELDLQTEVQQAFLLPHGWTFEDGLLPYNYPPFFAIVFVPLSFLPLTLAFHVWNMFNIALVLVSVKLLLHHQQKRYKRDFIAASLVVFAFFPVLEGLLKGQSSFLVLFALMLTYLALKSNRDHLAGVTLALGLVKPQLVIVIAAMMLYRRCWRTVFAFSITSVMLLLTSWMTVGIDGLVSYAKLTGLMLNWDSIYGFYPASMSNLRGTVYRFGQLYHSWLGMEPSPMMLKSITALLSAFVLVLILQTWKVPSSSTSPEFDLQFGQTVIGSLLVSLHLYGQDLALLILVGFLLVNYFAHHTRSAQAHRMIAVGHVTPVLALAAVGVAGQAQVVVLLLILFMIILQNEVRMKKHGGQN